MKPFYKESIEMSYIENESFERVNFTINPLMKGEYENCVFKNCDFSNAEFSEFRFIDCEFLTCNLSMATLNKTTFRDIKFKDCKMLGLLFYNCINLGLSVSFENCNLIHSSFYQRKIKKTAFINSRLIEVDFTECDLTASLFENCDLLNAKFENTVLEKADLRTSYNYLIDPESNRIKKAKFSLMNIAGLLFKYDIEIEN